MIFVAQGLTYPEACRLIGTLKEYDIESNITVGGVNIEVTPDQVNLAKELCSNAGASFKAGYSSAVEDVLMKSDSGYETLKRVTNDSIAILKEWD